MYQWIDSLGYDHTDAQFVVWDLASLVEVIGRQGEHRFLSYRYLDFVSYFAGQTGIMFDEATDQLRNQTFGVAGADRALKIAKIFILMQQRAVSMKKAFEEMHNLTNVWKEVEIQLKRFAPVENLLEPGEKYPDE